MKKLLWIAFLGVIAFGAWAMLRKEDPVTTAKLKCEFAVEEVTGYDIGILEVSAATVSGDVYDGRVHMRFDAGGRSRLAVCDFRVGKIWA